jgi:hypothetical protein
MQGFMDYVRKRVSHGICQECAERHFPTQTLHNIPNMHA